VFDGPGGHSFDKFGIVNPLAALARTVTGLYGIPVPAQPRTTYSASVVGGGTSVNTIPAQVFLDVDIRSDRRRKSTGSIPRSMPSPRRRWTRRTAPDRPTAAGSP
jgi:metal-dependent amidase/aminoacylase/carboxypeptidase family protein